MKRFCVKCQFDKPAEGFVRLHRGKFGRIKVHVCADCAGRMKRTRTVEQRDAFGQAVRERNSARASSAAMAREKLKGQV